MLSSKENTNNFKSGGIDGLMPASPEHWNYDAEDTN